MPFQILPQPPLDEHGSDAAGDVEQ